MVGYVYWPGEPDFNAQVSYYPNGKAIWDQRPMFAAKATDRAFYPLMWTDINRKYQGSWGRAGDPNVLTSGVNHFNNSGEGPKGSNEGYLDGHVEWAKGSLFDKTPKLSTATWSSFSMPAGPERSHFLFPELLLLSEATERANQECH